MDTFSVYLFDFSRLAPGLLKNYCVILPGGREGSVDVGAADDAGAALGRGLHRWASRSPLGSAGFIRTYECPVDFGVQILAAFAGQFFDDWAILRWDAVDQPLLHDLIADLQRIGKRLEGRVLSDRSG